MISLPKHRLARLSGAAFVLHSGANLAFLRSAVSFPTFNAGVNPLVFLGLTSAGAAAIARLFLKDRNDFSVWWRAAFLGSTFASGVVMARELDERYCTFGWYVMVMSAFHYMEYFVTAISNPGNLSTDSFLLNHSAAYGVAAAASWVEFFAEALLFPAMKVTLRPLACAGVVMCLAGDLLRKYSMLNAGRSFNHIVQSTKREDHRLVTDGIYAWFRHPSYVGWLYWSVGTQLILCNPICGVAYAFVSWKFFSERVVNEEYMLISFFGRDYVEYQRRVPTGLPFIRGYDNPYGDDDDN